MYEYHGWATIRESASFEEDEDQYDLVIQQLKEYVQELDWPSGVLDLRAVNGDFQLWIAGLNNHKPASKYDPTEVLKKVGKIAPGSYGVLYVRDSDDLELSNQFKVYSLIRGEIEEHHDPFLSPFIPKIEDDYEE
ncbi:Imm7 family immunity protein [Paenibacillus pabuli]|uniref:Imm7 family immunity protein n=1 Tax=Paenibacillus pabuli TaxID=1472 RepID=UPI000781D1E2|nr:Imm7 family immunity protein [Paenibacillus pabuli]MEC0123258.1 Imm7 family immunity protein [Paenibacillus pabuli]